MTTRGRVSIAKGKLGMYDRLAACGQRIRELGLAFNQDISGPCPSLGLKTLNDAQYKRYNERRQLAAIKRLKWWAFMGWFTGAHISAGTFIGKQLVSLLDGESQKQADATVAAEQVIRVDALHALLNGLALVATGQLKRDVPYIQRREQDFMQALDTDDADQALKALRQLRGHISKGNSEVSRVGSTFAELCDQNPLAGHRVVREVISLAEAPAPATTEQQLALSW